MIVGAHTLCQIQGSSLEDHCYDIEVDTIIIDMK